MKIHVLLRQRIEKEKENFPGEKTERKKRKKEILPGEKKEGQEIKEEKKKDKGKKATSSQ